MTNKKAPENTTRKVLENPDSFLVEVLTVGRSEAILNQEAEGQGSFVGSDTLPAKISSYGDFDEKKILKDAGVEFLGMVEGDKLFQYVKLPPGWQKVATDHSMWSNLVDDKGRIRARIFYKAACYDRDARLSLTTRFGIQYEYDREDTEHVAIASVTDCGKVIYTTAPIPLPEDDRKRFESSDKAKEAAKAWLDSNYPNWKNPGLYWD